MMEHGFFHPDAGYWQTLTDPSPEARAKYPVGTTEVPLKPGTDFVWSGTSWEPTAPTPAPPEQTEALRRAAYAREADPLFFKAQRGEATIEQWYAKLAEIKVRHPA